LNSWPYLLPVSDSPLLIQYREIKSRHTDAILFFRMGDFYEMFYDDAQTAARVLNITLTARGDGTPLAGVPVKAAAGYLRQFIARGFRVAICEQVEDPKFAKGLVKRAVVETITPGTFLDDEFVPGSRNNWLLALSPQSPVNAQPFTGLAALDLSTGEFVLETAGADGLAEALGRYSPAEVVLPGNCGALPIDASVLLTPREAWEFDSALAATELTRKLGVASLDGLGLESRDGAAVGAAGALLRYVTELQPAGLAHLRRPTVRRASDLCWLDEMTRRNLELLEPLRAGAKGVTLFETLDRTLTPMGARLLRQWVASPLCDARRITARHDAVATLVAEGRLRNRLREALEGVRDMERLAARAAASRANPREMGALRDSFLRLPTVSAVLGELAATVAQPSGEAGDNPSAAILAHAHAHLDTLTDLADSLASALVERPPVALADGGVIAPGHDAELDEICHLRDHGKQALAAIQQRERERTGINSLKVSYNRVFGYFIEVSRVNQAAVPADYERRQTLANAERYVTPELKDYEAKVLGAEERIAEREATLFGALREQVGSAITRVQQSADLIARMDVLASLADAAITERWVRPELHNGMELILEGSRHPVIERMMPREKFVPNDVRFDDAVRVLLVTGPNMAGKSTILRQIGLVVLLAQIGSFVPADRARIGLVDRLFTRVGASDNLAQGQSTFMVEMSETSAILHNATARSLVLLDEIGRGTSTYDGVAIAWAVTEHLHDKIGCRTMFATHYHELMQLPERLQHARNCNVAVRETGTGIVFLHRLELGGTDRSYGIHVAELAGLPGSVVTRARDVLGTLEQEHRLVPGSPPGHGDPLQPELFADWSAATPIRSAPATPATPQPESSPLAERLRALDPDRMTPLEALQELARLKAETP
jgi:DNA mismatch repair protein MutS